MHITGTPLRQINTTCLPFPFTFWGQSPVIASTDVEDFQSLSKPSLDRNRPLPVLLTIRCAWGARYRVEDVIAPFFKMKVGPLLTHFQGF
jgi:hypothetical protein